MGEGFRCSVAAAGVPMAGSAATDRAYLLVENAGPWGRKALEESRYPAAVREGLARRADRAGVRVQLVRRHGRSPATDGIRVFLVHADPRAPWAETTVLDSPEDLLELDLDGLAAGRRAGFEQHPGPLLLVCTNGRRDTCCAELGRPLVASLAAAHPEATWETTHVGGHRFAAAMLVLPHGLSYGRVDAAAAVQIADLTLQGRVATDHLRGRSAYPGPVQAAEVGLLDRLGLDGVGDLELVAAEPDGDVVRVTFRTPGGTQAVDVETVPGEAVRQSCADDTLKPTVTYRIR